MVIPLKFDAGLCISPADPTERNLVTHLEFFEGLAAVRVDCKWGYTDKTGQLVISLQYDGARGFSEGLAEVEVGGKLGFIDKTGQMVIPPKFTSARSFYRGASEVWMDENTWGLINMAGKFIWGPEEIKAPRFWWPPLH